MIFLYARVSTEEQGDRGWSLDGQISEIKRLLGDEEKTKIFKDIKSGSEIDRPGLQKMLDSLRICRPSAVYVWRPDRLSRCQSHFWGLLREIEEFCPLHSLNPSIRSNDPQGRLMLGILVSLAEYELIMIKERTKMGQKEARQAGHRIGSPGYGKSVKNSKLIDNPKEEKYLKIILELREKGLSLRSIAAELNKLKVPTKKKGLRWYASTILSIIKKYYE